MYRSEGSGWPESETGLWAGVKNYSVARARGEHVAEVDVQPGSRIGPQLGQESVYSLSQKSFCGWSQVSKWKFVLCFSLCLHFGLSCFTLLLWKDLSYNICEYMMRNA